MRSNELSFSNESIIELIKSTLEKNASLRFKVTGFSMIPFIRDCDIVTISSLSGNRLSFGKPVAFIRPDTKKLVIHRIVGLNNGSFIIKGDTANEPDGFIPKENILGCVTKVERNNRTVHLGLGIERLLIAFLSKNRILSLIYYFWRLIPFSLKKDLKRIWP